MSPQTEVTRPQLLIVDLGSQYTLKIESTLRELGYRSAIFGPERAQKWLENNSVKGIILSGGPASVNDADAPKIPDAIYEAGIPILAICYGMQDVAKRLGGKVESVAAQRGYGLEKISILPSSLLFGGLPEQQEVWASHGDSVIDAPPGFIVTARTFSENAVAAMCDSKGSLWCVQFHPEVAHTPYGKAMLLNFASAICGCEEDWRPEDIVSTIQRDVIEGVGDRQVVMGFSGGVDSSTLARLVAPVLKDRLHAILIDAGQLRENETKEIKRHAEAAGVSLKVISAKERLTNALGKRVDAETVRKIFRREYAAILSEEAMHIGQGNPETVVLLQGTLAPDLIESGLMGNSSLIKTHHNSGLGGLQPFSNFFKYEVRALARKLKLPKSISERQPFPGPGNLIRLPGLPKTPANLKVVKWAEARVREVLEKHGWYHRVSQLVVAYAGISTVGVKGDARVYKPVVIVRAVKTIDFMTAEGVIFPATIQREIVSRLTQHAEISRVFFDPTNKPPGTTEME